jgi:hypothetical protein
VRYASRVVTRKYPLDPLKRVRAEKVDQRARALFGAMRELEAAGVEVDKKTRAKEQLDESLKATARSERERLERGELTAADLAREAAWNVSADRQRLQAARAVDEAKKGHVQANAHVERERTTLATAQAEAKVVEKHHDKWRAARDAADRSRDEESAEEAHLARPKDGARR